MVDGVSICLSYRHLALMRLLEEENIHHFQCPQKTLPRASFKAFETRLKNHLIPLENNRFWVKT